MVAAQTPGTRESRARVSDPRRTERLLYIAELMSGGRWVRGKTAGELAAEWGLSQSTVEDYSSEASRLVKLLERPQARLRIARALDAGMSVVEEALDGEGVCNACGMPCGHAPLDAVGKLPALADKYAALTGANEPTQQKLEHSGRIEVAVEGMPPAIAVYVERGELDVLPVRAWRATLETEPVRQLEAARALVRELEAVKT